MIYKIGFLKLCPYIVIHIKSSLTLTTAISVEINFDNIGYFQSPFTVEKYSKFSPIPGGK